MLPYCDKLLEISVKEQLLNYLTDNNIIIPEQLGFRASHSCESALNVTLASWKQSIQSNKIIITVFLDLKRAFETIDRKLMLKKLQSIGIQGIALEWFSSYLTDRVQVTKFKNQTSTELKNDLGVPQGSVLRPLLFVIYMNDIVKCLQYSKVELFADDTLLHIAVIVQIN